MHGQFTRADRIRQTCPKRWSGPDYDEGGIRLPSRPGRWELRHGTLSYDAFRWGRWYADLWAFASNENLINHVRGKRWCGPQCLRELRKLLGRAG
jgi:hypothetical protein